MTLSRLRLATLTFLTLAIATASKQVEAQQPSAAEDTSLSDAARRGDTNAVDHLLQRAPDRRQKNRALLAAVEGGPVVIVIEVPPGRSNAPAAAVKPVASKPPWVKTVELLLDNGAYIEARDSERNTPLLLAATLGQTDIFMLLLERGADTHARNKYGDTPLIAAACECALATMNSTYGIVKTLLEKGADPNARNLEGTTALMNAASGFGGSAIVKLLLESGADPTAKDKHGNTALALALRSKRPDKVKLLKQATAPIH